jgi:dihydroflavonol-4-reductase
MLFITGGTGFLGAYIIKVLVEENYTVRAIRRSNKLPFFIAPEIFEKVEWIQGDILDPVLMEEAMDGVDAVIHAAAKVSFTSDGKEELFKTNIEGTINVVNAALAQNIKKFVYVSSVAALGRTINGEHVDEKKPWDDIRLNTNYAVSKYHAEMEVWRAIGEGLNAVIVNPSTIIGYGDWNNSSCAIFKSVYEEFGWYTNGINGFVDVEDVARAIVLLLEKDISSERFIINGDNWSFKDLFNTMADAFGKKHPWREATPFLGAIAWRVEKIKTLVTGKPSVLTRESAKIAQAKTYFSNKKLLEYIPSFQFKPLQKTIEEACHEYTKYANARANLKI